jgi:dihydrodipicolinate synthase/N-acetylneuraminate lyase
MPSCDGIEQCTGAASRETIINISPHTTATLYDLMRQTSASSALSWSQRVNRMMEGLAVYCNKAVIIYMAKSRYLMNFAINFLRSRRLEAAQQIRYIGRTCGILSVAGR